MTRYAVDKILWQVAQDDAYKAAFFEDAHAATAGRELSDEERTAVLSKDLRALFALGAHPFLLYAFAIAKNRGWSPQFMQDYVAELKGLGLGDIET